MTPTSIARHVSRARAERLVAYGRAVSHLVMAVASAVAADAPVLFVLGPWTLVSTILAWQTRRRGRLEPLPLLVACDLVVAGSVLTMTGGARSPYFPLILVAAFEASVLYGRRGMAWTAAGAVATYAAASVVATGPFELRVFVIRTGMLLVVWAIITRRAEHEFRTNADLERIATWPRIVGADRDAAIRELLGHASATLRSPRLALSWEDAEGTLLVARYDARDGAFTIGEGPLGDSGGAAIAARFESRTTRGTLVALDAKAANDDDRRLAEIVAGLVSSGLDQIHLAELQRQHAASGERLRLSRDLHDGLLQSLGAVALHAETARRVITTNPQVAAERLAVIVDELTEGQRSLREFVEDLRPELRARSERLGTRLGRLAGTIEQRWDVRVRLEVDPSVDQVEGRLADDVYALTAEAMNNAGRHAGATSIDGLVIADEGVVRIDVADDGRGFPFHGRYELPQLLATAQGSWSLKERVTALGGALAIDSSAGGARVEMRVPRSA